MKTTTLLALLIGLLYTENTIAQKSIESNSRRWTAHNGEAKFSGDTIHLINTSRSTAILWAKDVSFTNGIIELDIKGNEKEGESFLGVAFHALDDKTYEAVYFRPFAFRNPATKDRSIQYVTLPTYDWDVLREKHPGKYEHPVVPTPDPKDWFHVKIVVQYPLIKVFINGSNTSTLEITQLSDRKNGQLGLWVDSPDGRFRNVTVKND